MVPTTTYENDPLATIHEDYGHAVIHLTWDYHKQTRQRTLLFASVELLPLEMPLPQDNGLESFLLRGTRDYRLFVRHIVLPAHKALVWYRNCANGIAVKPEPDGYFKETPTASDLFANLSWSEEPKWPNLACVLDGTLTPFLSKWHQCARVHHLIATSFDLTSHWQDSRDRAEAAEWLAKQLAFDLLFYTSLWGSIHLIAPNPVFREFHHDRGKVLKEGFETVVYKIDWRSGIRSSDLTLIMKDNTVSGAGVIAAFPIKEELGAIVLNRHSDSQSVYVTDRHRGLLYGLESFLPLDGIDMNMQMVTTRRVVRDENGNPLFTVPIVGDGGPAVNVDLSSMGRTMHQQAAAILRSERNQQVSKREAQEKHERWFQGDKEEAVKLIRRLLLNANNRVLIVDPYFRRSELQFALGVSNSHVPIRILTSAEMLNEVSNDSCPPNLKKVRCILNCFEVQREKVLPLARKTLDVVTGLSDAIGNHFKKSINDVLGNNIILHGEELLGAVESANAQPKANPLELRVMIGGRPEVHDRFLLVDNNLWLLGSSLNEFGSRGTMIVPVIYPTFIEDRLEDNWRRAVSLKDWVEEKRVRRNSLRL